jgi:hypothetical protein
MTIDAIQDGAQDGAGEPAYARFMLRLPTSASSGTLPIPHCRHVRGGCW